jgi:NO-binding membrane sensor protein with MHYT domain/class 3 adenylate cyclase
MQAAAMNHFFYDGRDLRTALEMHYSPWLVMLSVAVCCLAAYSALRVAGRIRASDKTGLRWLWFATGAITSGIGNWAMHFIGMLAIQLPLPVRYDVFITTLTTLPAIFAIMVVLFVITKPKINTLDVWVGGSLLGAGIGVMHYGGMAAMTGVGQQIVMLYDPLLFALSITIAVGLSVATLWFNTRAECPWQMGKSPSISRQSALFMGLSLSGMHYTAMTATYFFPGDPLPGASDHVLDPATLALWVSIASSLVISLVIFITFVDSRLQHMARDQALTRSRMHEAIESITDGFSLFDLDDRLVEFNRLYAELMDSGSGIVPGMTFDTVIRGAAEAGLILDATGRIEAWLQERLGQHRSPQSHFLEHYKGDRWMRVSERRVPKIGTVAIWADITELKRTEIELSKAMAEAQRILLNVLPQPIATRLQNGENPIVNAYNEVTVLFADLVGFTPLSAQIPPTLLVSYLNQIFSAFDALANHYGLEKIKTIGDAYMAAAGIPFPHHDHAGAAARMAMAMHGTIEQFNQQNQRRLQLRIGIASGPVIAGVIGQNKFSYDLWGDTVNLASRMESHGMPGRTQLAATTFERLRERFQCEERGTIEVKGKGSMRTYFLNADSTEGAIVP